MTTSNGGASSPCALRELERELVRERRLAGVARPEQRDVGLPLERQRDLVGERLHPDDLRRVVERPVPDERVQRGVHGPNCLSSDPSLYRVPGTSCAPAAISPAAAGRRGPCRARAARRASATASRTSVARRRRRRRARSSRSGPNGISSCAPRSKFETAIPTSVRPRSSISGPASAIRSRTTARIAWSRRSAGERARARGPAEVVEPQPQRHGAARTIRLPHASGDALDEAEQDAVDLDRRPVAHADRALGADRAPPLPRLHAARVAVVGERVQLPPRPPPSIAISASFSSDATSPTV